jgi:hypothetical protein
MVDPILIWHSPGWAEEKCGKPVNMAGIDKEVRIILK